ncbi:hypothetical protein SAMN06297422_11475 [Lachnospiraceae bacterium]|nr:hypothetical protein SAMN06297422_11475 [Lachnospiraceae bacterium]
MINQLKIECFKMKRFTPLYVSILAYLMMWVAMMVEGFKPQTLAMFLCMHDGYVESVQDCSFAFLWGMLVAWYAGIDFTNRTLHISIVTGGNRWKVVLSRLFATSIITITFHVVDIISQVILYGKIYGFSFEGFCKKDIIWFLVVCLQMIAFNAFFLFITYICGSVYAALFASVTVSAIGGNILRNVFVGNYIYEHSFFCLAKSNANSDLIPCAICAIIIAVILVVATILYFNKKDITN